MIDDYVKKHPKESKKKFNYLDVKYLIIIFAKKLDMKIFFFGFALLIAVGCSNHKIHHTVFGDFIIDTMQVAMYDEEGSPCYVVHIAEKDSVEKAPGVWGYIDGPLIYYYNPAHRSYYVQFPTNDEHGNVVTSVFPDNKK